MRQRPANSVIISAAMRPDRLIVVQYRSLDIGETALRRWLQQLKGELSGVTPRAKALTTEQQRIQDQNGRSDLWRRRNPY